jgi:hypothetical protein
MIVTGRFLWHDQKAALADMARAMGIILFHRQGIRKLA